MAALPLGMRIGFKPLALLIASCLVVPAPSMAAVKQGDVCKKVGTTSTVKGLKYTCIKSGKKMVWGKGVPIKNVTPAPSATPKPSPSVQVNPAPTPSATPTPTPTSEPIVLPTSFADLYENRKGISLAAWQKSSGVIKANKSKAGTLEIFTGPSTKPYYDDYPTAVSLVSRLFPNRGEPSRTIVIRYSYSDIAWAETTLRSKITADEFTWLNNNSGGKTFTGRCDDNSKNCRGAMQQTLFSGVSLIIQGVPNTLDINDPTMASRLKTGMLEAHEYFHALQRIPIMGKSEVWPHAWFREGGAEWVQNMAINFDDYKKYREFIKADCGFECGRLSEADIVEFLEKSNENYTPPNFNQYLDYNLGALFIEALVAIKGPDSVIDMYEQMGKKITFDQAFKNTFGVEWRYAIPILARAISANVKDGL